MNLQAEDLFSRTLNFMPRNNLLHKVLIESPRGLDINNK